MKKIIYFWLTIAFVSCENVKQTYPQIESDWMDQQSFNELCDVITNNAQDYYKDVDREDTNVPRTTSNMRWCYEYGYDGDIFIYDNNHYLGKEKLKIVADDILKAFYKSDDFNFVESVFVNGLGNIRVAIKNEYVIPTDDMPLNTLQWELISFAINKKYGEYEAFSIEEETSEKFQKFKEEFVEIFGEDIRIISIYPDTEETVVKEQLGIDIKKEKEVRKYCGPNVKVKMSGGEPFYELIIK